MYRSRDHQAGVDYYSRYQYEDAQWGPRVYEKIGLTDDVANETTTYGGKITARPALFSAC